MRIPASLCDAGSCFAIVLLSAFAIAAPTDPVERALFVQNYDPLMALNRDIFASDRFLDRILSRPVVKVYSR